MRLNVYSSSQLYKECTKNIMTRFWKEIFILANLLFNSKLRLFTGKLKSKWSDPYIVKEVKSANLLFNLKLRLFTRKLKSKWSGPYIVKEVKPYGAIELKDPISHRSWVVNGQRVKPYLGNEKEELTAVILLNEP